VSTYNKLSTFNDFTIKGKINWIDKNPIHINKFNYRLSQYAPSIVAAIDFTVSDEQMLEFKKIESLQIKDRIIEVWFEPELYNKELNRNFFPGPYKLCIVNYTYIKAGISDYEIQYENFAPIKLIRLECIDPIFYQMTIQQKFKSFGETSTSNVVNKILSDYQIKNKYIEDTGYKFKWLQTQITDYEMIRSLLPYSKSTSGNLLYHFIMFNEEAYFKSITNTKLSDYNIIIDINNAISIDYQTTDMKPLIEKFGGITSLQAINSGYTNFQSVTPDKMNRQNYIKNRKDVNQHSSNYVNFINHAIDYQELEKIYISNLRQRLHTFSRIVTLETAAIPDLTPFKSIELISQYKGNIKELDGLFYIADIEYNYISLQNATNNATMTLYLISEVDSYGMNEPEGMSNK